ncbi:hypothetical protein DA2_3869 [Desulfovibrio sp. A2]|nr:hypothetical protein DA2_3869 [Desulfovibrio sp. A2]
MTLSLLSARRQLRAIRFSQHPVTQQKNCRAQGETGEKAPLCPALRPAHTHIMPNKTHIAATPWPFTAMPQCRTRDLIAHKGRCDARRPVHGHADDEPGNGLPRCGKKDGWRNTGPA